ncbi:MAG: hypothetical protein ACLQG3_12395 [Terracidiphilus sp.]
MDPASLPKYLFLQRRGCASSAAPLPVLFVAVLFAGAQLAHTQVYSRQEIGTGASLVSNTPTDFTSTGTVSHYQIYTGPLLRYTWNLSPSLALEGDASFPAHDRNDFSDAQSGDLLMTAGVKAGWRGRRFGVFEEIKPGGVWYPNGIEEISPVIAYFNVGYFVLQQGGVFEWYPARRIVWRVDVGQILKAQFDHTISNTPEVRAFLAGAVEPHLLFSLSASYRLGALREERESAPNAGRADLGFLFPLNIREHLEAEDLRPDRGFGGWGSVSVLCDLSLDAAVLRLPEDDQTHGAQDGGPSTEVFGGLKAGIRRSRMGYFVKFRPGFIRFDHGLAALYQTGSSSWDIQSRPLRNLALDMGGVLEVYVSKHVLLRADASNVYIHYHGQTVPKSIGNIYTSPVGKSSILFLFGAGWRF